MKTALALLPGFFIVALTSCGAISKGIVKPVNNTEIVPADFNPKKQILLVAEMPKPWNPDKRHNGATKKLVKQLQKTYPYQFELVTIKDIKDLNGKFSDTAKYKYAMVSNISSFTHTTATTTRISDGSGVRTMTTSPSAKVYSIDFRFYDRAQEKLYPESGNGSSYLSYTVPAFVETINKALLERKKTKTANKS